MKDINNNFLNKQSEPNKSNYIKTSQKLADFHATSFTSSESQYSEKSMLFFLETSFYHIFYTGISLAIIQIVSTEADLITLAVDPKHRKNSIGSEVLRHVIKYLKTLNIKVLFLEVSDSNYGAIRLYEKIGFKRLGIRKDYYSQGNQKPVSGIKMSYIIDIKAQN